MSDQRCWLAKGVGIPPAGGPSVTWMDLFRVVEEIRAELVALTRRVERLENNR